MAISKGATRPAVKKKTEIIAKIKELVINHESVIIFNCDNISSNQLKKVRSITRSHGVLIMGKNTLFKKAFLGHLEKSKQEKFLSQISGNVGLFFTNQPLRDVRDLIESVSEMAPVKVNMIAQCDVIIPKGLTSMPPDKTSFFQALNINTMIVKSFIEILSDIHLLRKGQKVGASEAALMQMLNIRPFSYKINSKFIFDRGMMYPPEALDIKQTDILEGFKQAISDISSISLAINYVTKASVPHIVQNSLMDLLSICLEADINNELVDEYKNSASQVSAVVVEQSAPQAQQTKKEPEPVEDEESDEDLGLSLFD